MNAAEKARLAHEKAEAEKKATKSKRKAWFKRGVEKVGDFLKRFSYVLLCTLIALLVIGSAAVFLLEAIGAAGNSFDAINMQKITFYVSIGFFIIDAVILFRFPGQNANSNAFTKFLKIAALFFGLAIFIMGCVTLGTGRLTFKVRSTFYDEANGVLYAEVDTGFTVWEISPEKEDVLILSEHEGLPVTGVHADAARNNSKIKTLTFTSQSNYELENSAFNGSSLTKVSFGDGSRFTVHDDVFAGCRRLTTVDCGSNSTLTFAGSNSFKECPALSEFRVNDSQLIINTTLDIECNKMIFGGETNAVIYVSGGDTSYISDNVGGVVVGKNSSAAIVHYSNNYDSIPVRVGTYRFEEGFDFDGSELFTAELLNYVFVQNRNYLALADEIYLPASVTYIPDNFFGDAGDGCKVYYAGSAEDWARLSIGENGNENYKNGKVKMSYNYAG